MILLLQWHMSSALFIRLYHCGMLTPELFELSSHLILGLPLSLLPCLIPSIIDFSKTFVLTTFPKYESFCFITIFSSETADPICSSIDTLVLFSVPEMPSNLLQHQNSKALILVLSVCHQPYFGYLRNILVLPYLVTSFRRFLSLLNSSFDFICTIALSVYH